MLQVPLFMYLRCPTLRQPQTVPWVCGDMLVASFKVLSGPKVGLGEIFPCKSVTVGNMQVSI